MTAPDESLPGDFHMLYPDEFEEAHAEAAGAYVGTLMATEGTPERTAARHDAFLHATQAAFNRGVAVGIATDAKA